MIIGIPKEIKTKETRVSVTPQGVAKLVQEGHRVLVQQNVGLSSGFKDDDYKGAGATLLGDGTAVWEQAELIVKVKEPVESEYRYLKPGLSLFTYLHLASVPPLMEALCQNKVTGIGYETVELSDGELPLLTPMSELIFCTPIMVAKVYCWVVLPEREKVW